MSTRPELVKRRRNVILCGCLPTVLLSFLLFVPQLMLSQTPRVPPPRRDIPPGPLAPVLTVSINFSYLLCNSLQLQSARRVVWEPVLKSLGATRTELNTYGLALDNAATEVCAERLDSPLMNSAFADLDRVMSGVEDRTFGRSLLTSDEKIKLSNALLQAAYDAFQSRCFDNRGKEAELVIGRLPKTPDVGLGLETQPASAALGRCGASSGGKAPGTGVDIEFAQSQFQACATKVLRNASQDCTDPAGQDRSGSTPRPATVHDTGWQPVPGQPGWQQHDYRVDAGDGTYKVFHQRKGPDGEMTVVQQYDAGGHLTYISIDFQLRGSPAIRRSIRVHTNPVSPEESPRDPAARRRYNAERRRLNDTSQRDLPKLDTAIEAALRVPPSVADSPDSFVRVPVNPAGPAQQCQAMTVSSTGGMGLLQPSSTDTSERSGSREWISASDLVLSCLCAFGSKGAQLANQIATAMGEPGVSCSNNEWLGRVDCVNNPRGPADQIRPECLAYLRADYQFDTPQTTCEAALNCPEGSHPILQAGGGCTCSRSGSSTSGRGSYNCSLVRCPPPGTRSSDPAVRACCGAPAGGPGTPPDEPPGGPPRPPIPDESKSKGNDPKRGPGAAVVLPKIFTAADLFAAATARGGSIKLLNLGSSKDPKDPDARLLDWSGVSTGDQLTLGFEFSSSASVVLYLSVQRGPQAGSLKVLVNGREIGQQLDLNFTRTATAKIRIGQIELQPQSNTITLVAMSSQGSASMHVALLGLSLEK